MLAKNLDKKTLAAAEKKCLLRSRPIVLSLAASLLLLAPAYAHKPWLAQTGKKAGAKSNTQHSQATPEGAESKDSKEANSEPQINLQSVLESAVDITPDDLVNKPGDYLNKNVKLKGNFAAFTNLALDYKPAFRSSKTHLSFLIFSPGTHIPLSELKIAMMMPKEKDPENQLLQSLKEGDELELVGKVFSTALDDPWLDVYQVKKVGAPKDEKKTAEAGSQDKGKSTAEKADLDKGNIPTGIPGKVKDSTPAKPEVRGNEIPKMKKAEPVKPQGKTAAPAKKPGKQ